MGDPGGPIFAIGDVHGCSEELDELLHLLPLTPKSTVLFLGDYIDRGANSRQVVERVLQLRRTQNVITLRGNHEAMLLEFLDGTEPAKVARFILNGGGATLASYGDDAGNYRIPGMHLDFFDSLELAYQTPTHFFVHAGVPNVKLADLDFAAYADELIWTRKQFLKSTFRWEKTIVHGHSPVISVEIAANRINLDTGCVFQRRLTAMEFPSKRIYSVEHRGGAGRTLLQDGSRRAAVRFRGAIPVEVDVHGSTLPFETVDYSEIGLGLRALHPSIAWTLSLGTKVEGRIGEGSAPIRFSGEVVRISRDEGGEEEVFGLRIELLDPPVVSVPEESASTAP